MAPLRIDEHSTRAELEEAIGHLRAKRSRCELAEIRAEIDEVVDELLDEWTTAPA